jgi:16S rRNA (uracil1498-N3)-methyltransferase
VRRGGDLVSVRIHVDAALAAGAEWLLPPGAARHVQVLRLQPGAVLTLFNGGGGQWQAEVLQMGRRDVRVKLLAHESAESEIGCAVTLALGMAANERMDGLVEKATELGTAAIQPLVCERSVLRVAGDRAERKAAHWRAVAVAACEQSGRNRVPAVATPLALRDWLDASPSAAPSGGHLRLLLCLTPDALPLLRQPGLDGARSVVVLSGPEGGLSPDEEALARRRGFTPVSLGARVLRADTAPLAALACIGALRQAGA